MTDQNQEIILAEHPKGLPTKDTFKINDIKMPEIMEHQVFLKTLYVSVDPGMRGFMDEGDDDSKGKKFKIGEAVTSRGVAQVMKSNASDFKKGDIVHGRLPWKKFQNFKAEDLEKVDPAIAPISTSVSMLGVPGLAAYFGMLKIGQPKKGETVVVSGAAGSVGSIASQIAKISGCKVIGIAGSEKKITYLENELGLDKGVNYKTTQDLEKEIAKVCPDGVDVFFDNVGGKTFDAVFANINKNARIVICGQIADYNETDPPQGPRPMHDLIKHSAKMEGFVVFDFQDEFQSAKKGMASWYKDGKLKYKENLIHGFENIPEAFMGLFKGDNIGKQMVKVAEPDQHYKIIN